MATKQNRVTVKRTIQRETVNEKCLDLLTEMTHTVKGEMEEERTGNERWHTRSSFPGPLQQWASVCVCVQALGGPLCVPAGACSPLKACAALPGGAPAVCCVILSGACLGRPFPHSARCAVKHVGWGERGGIRGKKRPGLSTLHGLDSRDIVPKPLQSSNAFSLKEHICYLAVLCTPQDELRSVHSLLARKELFASLCFVFNSLSYKIKSTGLPLPSQKSMETFLTGLREWMVYIIVAWWCVTSPWTSLILMIILDWFVQRVHTACMEDACTCNKFVYIAFIILEHWGSLTFCMNNRKTSKR